MIQTLRHTPRPWAAEHQETIGAPGHDIYEITDSRGVVICRTVNGSYSPASQTDKFNALALAAAPDLLSTLQFYADLVNWNGTADTGIRIETLNSKTGIYEYKNVPGTSDIVNSDDIDEAGFGGKRARVAIAKIVDRY